MAQRDRGPMREALEDPPPFPYDRVVKLSEIRDVINSQSAVRRTPALPDLSEFERAVERVAETAGGWGATVVAVILPSYELTVGQPADLARYEAVSDALRDSPLCVVDGVALFAAQPDPVSLFTLRMDNHPNGRGHAVLAEALVEAINSREKS